MKRTKTLLQTNIRTFNLNEGSFSKKFFTKEEIEAFLTQQVPMVEGVYSYEATIKRLLYSVYVDMPRAYVEQKLGLKQVLQIMHKLSNGDRGALSKQLYAYYQKVGVSTLGRDLKKVYKKVDRVEFDEDGSRYWTITDVHFLVGKKDYWGGRDGKCGLEDISNDHLRRCIAILKEKGYIEISNKQYTRGFRRSRNTYHYSNTYYKLTEKALKLLGVVQPQ
jgi:hypothetical protein